MRETKLWTWHIIAGIVILVFLGLHMGIMHLDNLFHWFSSVSGERAIAWDNVMARAKMAFFLVTYIVLLGAALYHGLHGLKTIIFELNLGKGFKRFCSVTLTVAGFALFVLGTYAAVAARAAAMKMKM